MHIGEKVEARARELRIGATELARLIKTSKQNIYGIYKRSSMDTELLQNLSRVLEFDFFAYYSQGGASQVDAYSIPYKKGKKAPSLSESELERLREDYRQLQEKYELLRALYESKTGEKLPGSR
jgi:hypothetical protein